PPRSSLFPYTTLFRSRRADRGWAAIAVRAVGSLRDGGAAAPGVAPVALHAAVLSGHLAALARARPALERQLAREFSLGVWAALRSEEHTSELQSRSDL